MKQFGVAMLAALLAASPGPAGAQDDPAAPSDLAAPPPTPAPAIPAPPEETLPTKVADVPGTWDLSLDGTNRRCVLTLLRDRGPAGQKVNFPAGCRRALPLMGAVAGWLYADEAVRLVDANIRPVFLFKRRPDRRSYVAMEKNETFSLVPLDIAGMRPPATESPQAEAPPPMPAQETSPEAAQDAAKSEPAALPAPQAAPGVQATEGAPKPGTYALDRFRQQATCRLDLAAGGAVKLLPDCNDEGIEVFNPVRWRYANGRMTLVAKRGHSIALVDNGAGGWRRDPEVGTTLVLRRIEP